MPLPPNVGRPAVRRKMSANRRLPNDDHKTTTTDAKSAIILGSEP
jgi:hypothetical protein